MDDIARSWLFESRRSRPKPVGARVSKHYLGDEAGLVRRLAKHARLPKEDAAEVHRAAVGFVEAMRRNREAAGGIDAFMSEYDLSSSEGIVLMCLAEALLRIPDAETADRLIADKLGDADWHSHLGTSDSLFVNAGTWALMLTGRFVKDEMLEAGLVPAFFHAVGRLGEPVIRKALRQAMRILGHQFVMGRTIREALQRAGRHSERAYLYSFDMLGEAALTAEDAARYFAAYADAIPVIAQDVEADTDLMAAPSISVKLSALTPRFEYAQGQRAHAELVQRVGQLAALARDANVALTIDAEEADRLELMLQVFESVARDQQLAGWPGFGLAVQAYQKRAFYVIGWLKALARSLDGVIPVRLVKGAYWDTEIKRAQEQGLADYPVFTRKSSTDLAFLACARALLDASPQLYPQFATHNAHSVAWILNVGTNKPFEFQRLHGMGEELYAELVGAGDFDRPCRVYAPVGSHEDLLPYLVRRLLENGANTSFVNRFVQAEAAAGSIVEDPVAVTRKLRDVLRHPRIPLPSEIFGTTRKNSSGVNLADTNELKQLAKALASVPLTDREIGPIFHDDSADGEITSSEDPADPSRTLGLVTFANAASAKRSLAAVAKAQAAWDAVAAEERSAILRRAAGLFEAHQPELVALIVAEAGRTVPDSLAEVREGVDFLRYYANECERLFVAPNVLRGPTGERNELRLRGRGVFLCISPWNFPLSIFTGQVAAALAAGNTVLAKPAEQTPFIAARVVELLHEAGVPEDVLHLLPGRGPEIGAALLPDARLAGVAFTGSTETGARINRALAARAGPIATLIAETGGINAMIADSSALPEQLVRDVLASAFNSAGQRCSALRLLCLQEDTADDVLTMLMGAMAELVIGDPALLSTDVGPVIDAEAKAMLSDYVALQRQRVIYQLGLLRCHETGYYFPPTLIELDRVEELTREVFGPVLHVVRYAPEGIDELVDGINATGFGLTLGVHSRIDSFARRITARARVGNVYVNRNMIGAAVGVQPFGGMGLSGTGPKAGGPHYLARFATEQTVSVNTAAVGGNATLLSLGEADED